MQCYNHPKVETGLTCGNCVRPICAKCLVHHPVGIRCHECARSRRLPTFDVTPIYYTRAILTGLLIGGVGGLALGFLLFILPLGILLFYFRLAAMAGMGYVIGEGISLSVNRKRGMGLQVIAGVSVFIAFVLSGTHISLFTLIALMVAVYLAIKPLRG